MQSHPVEQLPGKRRGGAPDNNATTWSTREVLAFAARTWLISLLIVILGVGVGVVVHTARPKTFTSLATIYISPNSAKSSSDLAIAENLSLQRAAEYARMVQGSSMAEAVHNQVGVFSSEALVESVGAYAPPSTSFVEVRATRASPTEAMAITEAYADEVVAAVASSDRQGKAGDPLLRAAVVDGPTNPVQPDGPDLEASVVLGLFAGLLGAAVVLLVRFVRSGQRKSR